MNNPHPIACTLDSVQLTERGRALASLGRDGLLSVHRGSRHVTLRFRGGDAIRRRVADIVIAESACCAFLEFALADEGDATVLGVTAPPGGEALLHQLADALAAGAPA